MRSARAAASPAPPAFAYRAKRYLMENGISLKQLVERFGMSTTSWSLFLGGDPRRQFAGGREKVMEALAERRLDVPAWLWDPETEETAKTSYRRPPEPNPMEASMLDAQFLSEGARKKFRLFANPFDPYAVAGPDGLPRLADLTLSRAQGAVYLRLKQAAFSWGFTAAYAGPGYGKSIVLQRALADAADAAARAQHRLIVVTPANIDRRRMTVGHIIGELLRQLSDQPVPQATNARDARLNKVLREYNQAGDRVALVIEEAHELSLETLKDIKRLHEGHHGFRPLLGILLVGQLELRAKLDPVRNPMLAEVAYRAAAVELGPIARDEVRSYLASRIALVGDIEVEQLFTKDAIDELGRQPDASLTPLNLNNVAMAALNCVVARGWDLVTAEVITDVLTAKPHERERWGSL
ncbi:AAA family ATPase [Longimicrobium sp.]|uniref:AAA family ATPase n=1 Tax=Longimicrobium sp. TaxID=2029185 RepID=UPI002E324402|nr:AAA family ATPase [Longimicrobium sp.]HEX6038957.1 AAA family ATPase [Longimicrobium sp.]